MLSLYYCCRVNTVNQVVNLMIFILGSILGIEEGDNAVSEVTEKIVKLLFGAELVALVEGGIVISHVLEDLLIEVVPQGRDQDDDAAYYAQCFEDFAHLSIISRTFAIKLIK